MDQWFIIELWGQCSGSVVHHRAMGTVEPVRVKQPMKI